ncbi:class I SAM-dependent methyltransferase [Streptomyces sp. NPDC087851]|uniref:class I SAM-dependent methyltransferase n=1 Tax=Streptomyces sp. NPDC087851 TaxID=3365810 RepID=UPI00382B9EC4
MSGDVRMTTAPTTEWGRALAAAHTIYDVAPLYEAIYLGRGKDYATEAATVVGLVKERNPGASDLLDVGCGPGTHLHHFARAFDRVEGADLAEPMIRHARQRLPEVPFHRADMRDFDLGRRFDAVTCLFSAVGNIRGVDELRATLRCLRRHLRPGGVLVVEPWWFPDTFVDGHVGGDVVEFEGTRLSRVSYTVGEGDISRMTVHYVVARTGEGIWHFTDEHAMALFPRETYLTAFQEAGLDAELLDLGNGGPGAFVGTLPG